MMKTNQNNYLLKKRLKVLSFVKAYVSEKGLNQNQYIIPGAGGVGELLNNSFV